jgi:heme/copper-type cytochrome/quinol oxidase subunit 2
MPRILIAIGAVVLLAGLLWPWLSKLGLGRLPGDIHIETENGFFYFPITTGVIISIVISLLIWFTRRQGKRRVAPRGGATQRGCVSAHKLRLRGVRFGLESDGD